MYVITIQDNLQLEPLIVGVYDNLDDAINYGNSMAGRLCIVEIDSNVSPIKLSEKGQAYLSQTYLTTVHKKDDDSDDSDDEDEDDGEDVQVDVDEETMNQMTRRERAISDLTMGRKQRQAERLAKKEESN